MNDAIVYWQIFKAGALTAHGNFSSSYADEEKSEALSNWRDFVASNFDCKPTEVFIIGVFKL